MTLKITIRYPEFVIDPYNKTGSRYNFIPLALLKISRTDSP
ncbi:hypothetical protein [Tenacibaculum haliotis]|nr:hypothetical protein [Tenacibaculum haliotis]MCT4700161.1 hypothetical protein [Tenacibaculum haliotis]